MVLTRNGALGIACELLKVAETCGKYILLDPSFSALPSTFQSSLTVSCSYHRLVSFARSLSSSVLCVSVFVSLHRANASSRLPLRFSFSFRRSRANPRRSPLHLKSNELSVGYIISEVMLPVRVCANVCVRAHARPCVCSSTQHGRVARFYRTFSLPFFFPAYTYASNKMKSRRIGYAVHRNIGARAATTRDSHV